MIRISPVVLAGGGGTRLWPLSRDSYPKQFLKLDSPEFTLFQQTLSRLGGPGAMPDGADVLAPLVICNEEYRFFVLHQAQEVGVPLGGIVLEPVGRNTAPAVTVAALLQKFADSILLVVPADHRIGDSREYREVLAGAVRFAAAGEIVVFGVPPVRPETGYGYIEAGEKVRAPGSPFEAFRLRGFREKPDLATARRYLEAGGYLWNSGIFVLRADVWLRAVTHCAPEILVACRAAVAGAAAEANFLRLDGTAFAGCPSLSVDHAVMERLPEIAGIGGVVIPFRGQWSDVGSFTSLWELTQADGDGNVIQGDVIALATRNSAVRSERRLVVTLGVDDLVIVETGDAVLVTGRDQTQNLKQVVSRLQEAGRPERLTHRRVYRPWGSFETIDEGERFKVKRITVMPGHSLSLQLHHQRAEHWVVVRGTAAVVRGDENFTLNENESTYIPSGVRHRLGNPGQVPLEIIEVQSGAYLGEDDIVRFEDAYDRK